MGLYYAMNGLLLDHMHCVNVVTVTVKCFKMRVRIHSTHAMDDKMPRSSPSVCAYCK